MRFLENYTVPERHSSVLQAEAAVSSAPASSNLLYFTERGPGAPLLLVHGLMVTGEMFEPVLDHFAGICCR
jgi:hypothetical protein